jgi:hypothetical protein
MPNDTYSDLAKLISTHSMEEQCAYIENWLKQHYSLDGIGFFLKEPESTWTHFFTDSVPMDVVQNLQEILISINQTKETESEVLLFQKKDSEFTTINQVEDTGSLILIGVAIPLKVPDCIVGTLTLLSDSETIHKVTAEIKSELSFVFLISMLLNNAFSLK